MSSRPLCKPHERVEAFLDGARVRLWVHPRWGYTVHVDLSVSEFVTWWREVGAALNTAMDERAAQVGDGA